MVELLFTNRTEIGFNTNDALFSKEFLEYFFLGIRVLRNDVQLLAASKKHDIGETSGQENGRGLIG